MVLRLCIGFVFLWGSLGAGLGLHAGSIKGTVDLSLISKKSRMSSRYSKGASGDVGEVKPVAVVYLEGEFADETFKDIPLKAEMGQRDLLFVPSVLPVLIGTTVHFPNYDDDFHNVFSYSKSNPFDLGRYAQGDPPGQWQFTKPGVVKVFCEVHEHMRSTILVLETPFFVSTDETGGFLLENIPAGDYVLKCFVSPRKTLKQNVSVEADGVLEIAFAQ